MLLQKADHLNSGKTEQTSASVTVLDLAHNAY